nr:unnamed protein product [Callosobruchus analis]
MRKRLMSNLLSALVIAATITFAYSQNTTLAVEGISAGNEISTKICDIGNKNEEKCNATIGEQTKNQKQSSEIKKTDSKQGKALNFSTNINSDDHNILYTTTSEKNVLNHHNIEDVDLSDVSIDEDDADEDGEAFHSKILAPKMAFSNGSTHLIRGICEKGGLTYENGEKLEIGCDSICTCENGKMDCKERCTKPYIRKGSKKYLDSFCSVKDVDDQCCQVLICADTETEALEICTHNNKTYNRGDTIKKDCSEVCTCTAGGKVHCKQRCPEQVKTSERCLEIEDPLDSCCKRVFCDVEENAEPFNTNNDASNTEEEEKLHKVKRKITSARYLNSSVILVKLEDNEQNNKSEGTGDFLQNGHEEEHFHSSKDSIIIDVSDDRKEWISYRLSPGGYLFVKTAGKYLRLDGTDDIVEIENNSLGNKYSKTVSKGCSYKGKSFKLGEEYNDECNSLCVCHEIGMKCMKLQCPTYFGIDVLDPNCVEWETIPKNFVAKPPICCPESIKCKNNGSCEYKGQNFKNWEELPTNVTGCEKRCYCEMGKVECHDICPPVTALPPANLNCPPHLATISHTPEDDCCKKWTCNTDNSIQDNHGINAMLPNGHPFNGFQHPQAPQDEIVVHTLEAIDSHTVRLAFMVPRVIVGLHGRVEVRYTHDKNSDDPSTWLLQVFAPPSDLIATASLEFDLLDLKPDTEYKIKITVTLRDLHTTPTSRVYKIKTPKEIQITTLPPSIPIEPDLSVVDVNSTWVTVSWRKFTEYELQFIDGVQLRYKEIDGKIYAATSLIHRAVTSYTLENLKPNTKYELGIDLIPFAGQLTELHAKTMVHFTTANQVDTYGFNVTLDINQIKSQSVEISWSGVPYPEDKYVSIYRAIYQSDSGKEDHSTFKIAKRDSPTKTVIMDLKPGTRYRIWLEVYLTNGKVKTSNVQNFVTKPRLAPHLGLSSTTQDKLSRAEAGSSSTQSGDYYAPLVIVAILASLAIISTLVLLMILLRRHNQNKAAITPPTNGTRVSQSAYDNPTYKVEIQQETIGKY